MLKNNRILSANVRHVLATSVLTTAFAFTLVVGHSSADTYVQVEQVQEEELLTQVGETIKEDESFVDLVEGDQDLHTVEEAKTPALLPGDLLYFTKQIMENIRLALTFDDEKEAKLLLTLVEERIQEAAALLAQGKEDEANDVLQKAIDQQELAFDKYGSVEEAAEEEQGEEVVIVDEEAIVIEGTKEEEAVVIEDTEDKEEPSIPAELETKFSSNILALQAALDKVGNDQARASLEKNIIKAQERLEKKINKRLAKLEEQEGAVTEEEAEKMNEDLTEEAVDLVEDIDKETGILARVSEKANKEAKKAEEKQQKAVTKKTEEKQREEAKQQREAAKKAAEQQRNEAKQQREAAKKVAEQQREEAKQQRDVAKKAAEQQRNEAKQQKEKGKKAEDNKRGKNE